MHTRTGKCAVIRMQHPAPREACHTVTHLVLCAPLGGNYGAIHLEATTCVKGHMTYVSSQIAEDVRINPHFCQSLVWGCSNKSDIYLNILI